MMRQRDGRRYLEGFAHAARVIAAYQRGWGQAYAYSFALAYRDHSVRNAARYDRGFIAGVRAAFGG